MILGPKCQTFETQGFTNTADRHNFSRHPLVSVANVTCIRCGGFSLWNTQKYFLKVAWTARQRRNLPVNNWTFVPNYISLDHPAPKLHHHQAWILAVRVHGRCFLLSSVHGAQLADSQGSSGIKQEAAPTDPDCEINKHDHQSTCSVSGIIARTSFRRNP